jgi:large subunit ribosomal protein L25
MEIIKIEAALRPQSGKGPANRVRQQGRIPAVAYGKTLAATPIAIAPEALVGILHSQHGKNAVVEIGVDGGKSITAMLREYTYHPVTRAPLHADFVEIKLDQPVDVEVPLTVKGKAAGIVLGGVLRQVFRTLPIRCLPEKIPTSLEHDVTPLGLGEHVKTSEIAVPEGVTIRLPPEQTIIAVVAPEKEREEAAAPGAPGAPAAGAAAPAAGGKDAGKAAPAKAAPAKDAKKK